jgi:hypothetical protein
VIHVGLTNLSWTFILQFLFCSIFDRHNANVAPETNPALLSATMSTPFSDITLYAETRYGNDTPEYWEETSLQNYISDLYISKMHGYKPPQTTRVSIIPAYHKIWNRTWTHGSLKLIAPEFNYEKYLSLDKRGKYQYVLDIIHTSMIQLSEEYNWDMHVFEKAHREVLQSDFQFRIDYPLKTSRDKKHSARLYIEKTEVLTSLYAEFSIGESFKTAKFFDKRNWFWYDSIYRLVKTNKWFDNDRFGIYHKPLNWMVWYSLKDEKITFERENVQYDQMNIDDLFRF